MLRQRPASAIRSSCWPPPAAGASSTSACTASCCWSTARSASPAAATTRTTITTGTPSTTSAIATCWSPGRWRARWPANFEAFWASRAQRRRPSASTMSAGCCCDEGVPERAAPRYAQPQRAEAMSRAADDGAMVRERLVAQALPVGAVQFLADLPEKHRREPRAAGQRAPRWPARADRVRAGGGAAADALPGAEQAGAAHVRATCRTREHPPRVVVSTNSLAATDAFIAYALSHKYKRRYLRDFGFHIYEYKPFPADAPIDLAAIGPRRPTPPRLQRRRSTRPLATPRRAAAAAGAPALGAAAREHRHPLLRPRRQRAACRCAVPACASACMPSRWWWTSASA